MVGCLTENFPSTPTSSATLTATVTATTSTTTATTAATTTAAATATAATSLIFAFPFTFTLPLAQNKTAVNLSKIPSEYSLLNENNITEEEKTDLSTVNNGHILVVDDELSNQQVLQNQLSLQYYKITIASNGQEALELLEHRTFDLIILDVETSTR